MEVNGKGATRSRKATARPVPKSKLTLWCDARKNALWGAAARLRKTFFGDTWAAALMWLVAALACIALLLWFFFFSGMGTPAEPIYEGF